MAEPSQAVQSPSHSKAKTISQHTITSSRGIIVEEAGGAGAGAGVNLFDALQREALRTIGRGVGGALKAQRVASKAVFGPESVIADLKEAISSAADTNRRNRSGPFNAARADIGGGAACGAIFIALYQTEMSPSPYSDNSSAPPWWH